MSDNETNKDISRVLRTGTVGTSHVLEKAGDKLDNLAKTMSKSQYEQSTGIISQENTDVHATGQSDYSESQAGLGLHTQVSEIGKNELDYPSTDNDGVDADTGIHTQSNELEQMNTVKRQDLIPLQNQEDNNYSLQTGSTLDADNSEKVVIRTDVNNKGQETSLYSIKTSANTNEETIETDLEGNATSVTDDKVSKIKTGTKKAMHFINKKTFDFQAEQGKLSKTMTVVGKSGKAIGKTGKTVARSSDTLRRAFNQEDGTGADFFKESITKTVKRTAGKKASKLAGKGMMKLLMMCIRLIKSMIKFLSGIFTAIASYGGILIILLCAVALITSIFGMNGSETSIQKYEEYMISVQQQYDKQVDDWIIDNPEGIVIGVRGDYGRIDWRVPLSVIQATGAKLEFDFSEQILLKAFADAGLLEKHTETEQEIIEVDENDKEVVKKIKVLTITNAGYDEYMQWCKSNYGVIQMFMGAKGVYEGETEFTSDQMQIIDSLNSSDSFFDMFSDAFKEHATTTGSNASERDFNSPEYNSANIFTQAGYKGQCTWYAYGRALKLTGKKMPSGDAQTWINSAIAMGYPTGTRPSKNAVVVLSGGSFGHVAFVEAWDGTSLTVSEGNYNNPYANTNMMVEYARNHAVELVHEQTYPDYNAYRTQQARNGLTVVGFIYLD